MRKCVLCKKLAFLFWRMLVIYSAIAKWHCLCISFCGSFTLETYFNLTATVTDVLYLTIPVVSLKGPSPKTVALGAQNLRKSSLPKSLVQLSTFSTILVPTTQKLKNKNVKNKTRIWFRLLSSQTLFNNLWCMPFSGLKPLYITKKRCYSSCLSIIRFEERHN